VDDAAGIVSRALDAGLLLVSAGTDVVRLLPPLVIGDDELRRGIAVLEEAIPC
jgi:4-aminobutyrate aminotransferase-like enzyme